MKLRNKIAILASVCALCLVCGGMNVKTPSVSAETSFGSARFYMHDGAAVSKVESYGGIRWTTTVEWNYQPNIANENYTFGTFVVPTSTYRQAQSIGMALNEIDSKINIPYKTFKPTTLKESGVTFYTAVRYDDILRDYRANNPETDKTDEEILNLAYKLELTAISYAYDETTGEYHYAESSDVSRSARQVANAALLAGELDKSGVSSQVKSRVEGYVGDRNIGTISSGYLDLTELKNGIDQTLTIQSKDVAMQGLDFSEIEEVVIGAKRMKTNIDETTGSVVIDGVPINCKTYENGEFTYVSLFTKNGDVYSIPAIAADRVISTYEQLNEISSSTTGFSGYYVLKNNIDCWGGDKDSDGVVDDAERLLLGTTTQPAETVGLQNAVFDGQGYTIKNFQTNYGVFPAIKNSKIKNLGIVGKITGNNPATALVARHILKSELQDVYVKLTGWNNAGAGSPVAASLSETTLKNCMVETVTLASVKYNENSSTYHNNAMASISAFETMSNFKTNRFEGCYVVSGMPLNMCVARSASGSYRGSTTQFSIPHTFTAHNDKVYGAGSSNGYGVYGYVESLGTIIDVKAESEIQADDQYLKTELFETRNADGSKKRLVTMTHYASGSAIKEPASVQFDLLFPAGVKTTKKCWWTNRSNAQYRYFDYTSYAQIGNNDGNLVKRYDTATAMREDEENNDFSEFGGTYWTNSSGYLKWKTA